MSRLGTQIARAIGALLALALIYHLATAGGARAASVDPAGIVASSALVAGVDAVRIPERSARHRIALEREASAVWGVQAPTARIAAQLHQESAWRPDVSSAYAHGLAQFTPSTAAWLPSVCPSVGAVDVWDPEWSMRAVVCYDRWLYDRVSAASECDRWAFALSAYNGGIGWITRDKARASAKGADQARWWGHVELHTSRALWARDENRSYVRRILLLLEPAYIRAGWPGTAVCP